MMNNKYLFWLWTCSLLCSSNSETVAQSTTGSSSSNDSTINKNDKILDDWSVIETSKWGIVGTGSEIRETIYEDPDKVLKSLGGWVQRWRYFAEQPEGQGQAPKKTYQKMCKAVRKANSPEDRFIKLCQGYSSNFLYFLYVNQDTQQDARFTDKPAEPEPDTEWELVHQRVIVDLPRRLIQGNPPEPEKINESTNAQSGHKSDENESDNSEDGDDEHKNGDEHKTDLKIEPDNADKICTTAS